MEIYIDNDYKCHAQNDGTMRQFDVQVFDGKCSDYINGYRYVPKNETWVRDDGVEFEGEMIAPCIDSKELEYAQRNYQEGADSQDGTIAELMDTIEDLCEELIG